MIAHRTAFLALLAALCACAWAPAPPNPRTPDEAFSAAFAAVEQTYDVVLLSMRNPTTPLSPQRARVIKEDVDDTFVTLTALYEAWQTSGDFEFSEIEQARERLATVRRLVAALTEQGDP